MQLTQDQLGAYVQRRLGDPFWDIELTPVQIKDCITDAILCYSRWKPVRLHRPYALSAGILKLDSTTTPAVPEKVTGILDWSFTTNLAQGNPNIEAQMLSGTFAFYGVRSPLYDIRFFHYQKEWVRFAGKELNSYPDLAFRLNEETGVPQLWLYSPGYATDFDVTFAKAHEDLATIPGYDENRIRNLTVARAKMTLGEVRSKYDKVLIANQSMVLNGEKLKTEGQAEWDAEEEKLRLSVADQAPIWA